MGEGDRVLRLGLEGRAAAASGASQWPKREVRGASEGGCGPGHGSHCRVVDIVVLVAAVVCVRELAFMAPSLEGGGWVLAEEVGGRGLAAGVAGVLREGGAQARCERGALSVGVGCVQTAAGIGCVLGERCPTAVGGD